jgi:hypothetical protein
MPSIAKELVDKMYECRNAATLDLEKSANATNKAMNGALIRLLIN